MFDDVITVYNHFTNEEGGDAWNKTTVKGVQWVRKVEKTVSTDGRLSLADNVDITIPDRACGNYLNHIQYAASEKKEKFWTLSPEHNLDMVVLGEVPDIIKTGKELSALSKKYADVATVASVQDNRNTRHLKHIRVVAK